MTPLFVYRVLLVACKKKPLGGISVAAACTPFFLGCKWYLVVVGTPFLWGAGSPSLLLLSLTPPLLWGTSSVLVLSLHPVFVGCKPSCAAAPEACTPSFAICF